MREDTTIRDLVFDHRFRRTRIGNTVCVGATTILLPLLCTVGSIETRHGSGGCISPILVRVTEERTIASRIRIFTRGTRRIQVFDLDWILLTILVACVAIVVPRTVLTRRWTGVCISTFAHKITYR